MPKATSMCQDSAAMQRAGRTLVLVPDAAWRQGRAP